MSDLSSPAIRYSIIYKSTFSYIHLIGFNLIAVIISKNSMSVVNQSKQIISELFFPPTLSVYRALLCGREIRKVSNFPLIIPQHSLPALITRGKKSQILFHFHSLSLVFFFLSSLLSHSPISHSCRIRNGKKSSSGSNNASRYLQSPRSLNEKVVEIIRKLTLLVDPAVARSEKKAQTEELSTKQTQIFMIIDKLSSSEGRTLQKLLFSLKEMFEDDRDFVHDFVTLGGLNCLVQIGRRNSEQNHQMFVLRALGQLMLYISGMNAIAEHDSVVNWLYSLTHSKYRLIVKTSLKLLIVFVEYCEPNCHTLCKAVRNEDGASQAIPWSNVMRYTYFAFIH